MPTSARINIFSSDEDLGVQGRLGDRYESGQDGKKTLLVRCVSSGFILKECGLQDIVLELDNLPDYRNGTASQRRALLLSEITRLFGAGSPVPPVQPVIAPPATSATTTSESIPETIKPVEPAQLTDITPVEHSEPTSTQKRPNLGRPID